MNLIAYIKIFSISLPALISIFFAVKKPGSSKFFEYAAITGIFIFALFIPIKDGFAIFGMVAAIVFFTAYKIAKRGFSIMRTGFNIPMFLYLGMDALSFLWSYSLNDSIVEFSKILYFFAFFFAAAELLNSVKKISFMLGTFAFSITLAIMYGLYQKFFIAGFMYAGSRLTGFNNYLSFPVQVSYGIVMFLCFYAFNFKTASINGGRVENGGGRQRNGGGKGAVKLPEAEKKISAVSFERLKAYIPAFIISIIVIIGFFDIVMTKTRSALLGIVPAILVIALLKSKKLFIAVIVFLIAANAGSFYLSKTYRTRVMTMFNPAVYKTESKSHLDAESHICLIESGLAMFEHHPLTGVGAAAFTKYFKTHKDVQFPWYHNPKTGKKLYCLYLDIPGNGYVQTLSEIGIFGFIILMWLFVEGIRKPYMLFKNSDDDFKKKISVMMLGITIVFMGAFTSAATMSDDKCSNLFFFFLAVFAAASALRKNENNKRFT